VPWLTRARVSNYRSLADVDVRLGALTLLVGPNGAGKSNFLDALRFLADAIATSPHQAASTRGGVQGLLRRQPDTMVESFLIEVDVQFPWEGGTSAEQLLTGQPNPLAHATYQVHLAPQPASRQRRVEVIDEACRVTWRERSLGFTVREGNPEHDGFVLLSKKVERDRLLLPLLGTTDTFAPLVRALESMRFYHLDPQVMRQPVSETEESVLGPTGEHLASVLGGLAERGPKAKARLDEYLGAIVPGVRGIDREYVGKYVGVVMRQEMAAGKEEEFRQSEISDGTIRAAGVLAALFQPSIAHDGTSLVAIEEPELALHPAAAGVLFDALTEACQRVQVVATSQSADLFDRDDIDPANIRVVTYDSGRTIIGEIDEASARIAIDHRMTIGELMRGNQLSPRLTERA
jgi:predicted ATPase